MRNLADLINNDELAARGAGLIDLLLIVGIVAAILLVNRFGSIRLQVTGVIGCAVGLAIASASPGFAGATQTALIFAGFMIFNFMTNMGPNAQTYLIAGEVFPTKVRAMGAGFAAASQSRRGLDRVPVSDPARRHRNQEPPLYPGRHVSAGRAGDLGLPDPDDRRQPRGDRNDITEWRASFSPAAELGDAIVPPFKSKPPCRPWPGSNPPPAGGSRGSI